MTLFRSKTHQEVWIDRWCHRCFQPNEAARRIQGAQTMCPILGKALASGRKPPQWDRMPRADEMERSIRCNSFQDKPADVRRTPHQRQRDTTDDEPLFDVTPYATNIGLVPVEGWPDKPQKDGVDHA